MIKPRWLLAGVMLLGTASLAGAIVVASPGGEEEVVQETPSPSLSASASPQSSPSSTATPSPVSEIPAASPSAAACNPNPTPAPGTKLWRWDDLIVLLPEDGEVLISGGVSPQDGQPLVVINLKSNPDKGLVVSTKTGAVIDDQTAEKRAAIDPVVASVSICPLDPSAAPWPYTRRLPEGPRLTFGKLRYFEPDPATGIEVSGGTACAQSVPAETGGCQNFLGVKSARSSMYFDSEIGALIGEANIAPEEQEAFDRYRMSIEIASQ